MPTRYLVRDADFPGPVGDTAGNVTPVYVDSDDSKVKFYDRTSTVWRTLLDGREPIITPTAAAELTAAQTGSQIMLNAAAGFAITLPLPAAGLRYRFTVAAAFATTNFTVVTNGSANIIEGSINVAGAIVDADARDVITFVATAENIGDFVEVWSDGTSWFVFGNALTAGGITFGQT
jgi:hypothetical protein